MTVLAACLALLSVLVAMSGAEAPLHRLTRSADQGAAWLGRPQRRARLLVLVIAGAAVALWLGTGLVTAMLAAAGGAVYAVARKLAETWELRRDRRRRQRTTIGICDGLAAELRAGLPALPALLRSCEGLPELAPVLSAVTVGADIPVTLRRSAGAPGAEGLRAVAAAWEVAASSGAALAAVLERVAESLRNEEDARAEVTAALGPPRATARLLAGLPLAGIALGQSMGSSPIGFLLGSPWGLACLSIGGVLALTGVWWVELLASAAER